MDFRFRGIPQRVSQQSHYVFGGRADVSFKSYVLNEDELKKLNEEIDASDVGDVLRLIEGSTGESMAQLQEEINFFLEEKEDEQERKKSEDDSNPFTALIGGYESKPASPETAEKKAEAKKEKVKIKPENYAEKEIIRKLASKNAEDITFRVFDTYKKAHGMPSYT